MLQKTTLDNGLQIFTELNNAVETVTISYTIRAGSYQEDESNYGIAHFAEHMLFKGTLNRTSQQISEAIEEIGGILNAATSFDYTKYYCVIPKEFWKTGIDILSDLVWNNTIPEEEFEREKLVVLEELKMCNDDAGSKIWDLLFTALHPSYKNRQLVGGTLDTVKNIDRQQMLTFIDKYYIPNNMFITITGNIDHNEAVNFIKNYCNDIDFNNTLEKTDDNFKPDKLGGEDLVEKKDISQSHLSWGIFGPKPNELDYVIGEVISTLLGGSSCSRLFQIVREQKGLAYTVKMDIEPLTDISIVSGYVGLDGNNIQMVKDIILEELNKLKVEDVLEDELNRVKIYIKGTSKIATETTSAKNSFITCSLINNFTTDIDEYFKLIDNVTSKDIKEFANKYFRNDNISFVKIIPIERA